MLASTSGYAAESLCSPTSCFCERIYGQFTSMLYFQAVWETQSEETMKLRIVFYIEPGG